MNRNYVEGSIKGQVENYLRQNYPMFKVSLPETSFYYDSAHPMLVK